MLLLKFQTSQQQLSSLAPGSMCGKAASKLQSVDALMPKIGKLHPVGRKKIGAGRPKVGILLFVNKSFVFCFLWMFLLFIHNIFCNHLNKYMVVAVYWADHWEKLWQIGKENFGVKVSARTWTNLSWKKTWL